MQFLLPLKFTDRLERSNADSLASYPGSSIKVEEPGYEATDSYRRSDIVNDLKNRPYESQMEYNHAVQPFSR